MEDRQICEELRKLVVVEPIITVFGEGRPDIKHVFYFCILAISTRIFFNRINFMYMWCFVATIIVRFVSN